MPVKVYGLKAMRPEMKGVIRDLRVTILLEELAIPYERITLDPSKGENKTEAYLKLNPTGKVPTLVDEDFTLFESAAINEYLAEKHKRFIPPAGSREYYLFKQWNYFVLTNLDPQVGRVYAADFFMEKGDTTSTIRALAMEQIVRFLKSLDQQLEKNLYLAGSELTIADFTLTASLTSIRHTNLLGDYPSVQRHFAAMTERASYKKSLAANGS
jgi:glutathione S-transferase